MVGEKADIDRRSFIKATTVGAAGLTGYVGSVSADHQEEGFGDWRPERNVSVIVPWGAGGGTDTATRAVTNPAEDILSNELDTDISINVENVTGANGLNGAARVLSQPADGHTLFANTQVIGPMIATGQADFTLDDWAAVARVQHDTSWLMSSGREDVGHDSIDSLLEKAQNEPIQMGAVGGVTGAAFTIQWANAAGVLDNLQIVPFDDAGRMRTDVIAGEIDGSFAEIQEVQEQVESGDIELLLVGTEERLEEFPDVPASGERDWDATFGVSRGINARTGTPDEALQFWESVWHRSMQEQSYQDLIEQTLLDLRPGFQNREDWGQTVEENVEFFTEIVELFDQATGEGTTTEGGG